LQQQADPRQALPKNASVTGFHGAYIDWVIIPFQWLSSINLSPYRTRPNGRPGRSPKDPEWRFSTIVLVSCSGVAPRSCGPGPTRR
jgi:hypothetical protein